MRIAVLGGGVIGVSTAYYLAERGHEFTVIERRKGPALETIHANAGEISPGLSAPWSGLRPMNPDGTPTIGRPVTPNLYVNTGHGSLGWAMACVSAKVVADLVSNKKSEIDLNGLTRQRYD